MHARMCVHVYVWLVMCVHVSVYVGMCISTYVCMHACMHVSMYVGKPVLNRVSLFPTQVPSNGSMPPPLLTPYQCAPLGMNPTLSMHACVCVCMHACTYVCICVCMLGCMHAYKCVCMYVCVCVHVCVDGCSIYVRRENCTQPLPCIFVSYAGAQQRLDASAAAHALPVRPARKFSRRALSSSTNYTIQHRSIGDSAPPTAQDSAACDALPGPARAEGIPGATRLADSEPGNEDV